MLFLISTNLHAPPLQATVRRTGIIPAVEPIDTTRDASQSASFATTVAFEKEAQLFVGGCL
jgi:hypothetical protein